MAAAEEIQLSLKVMLVKESNKVLYAEIDSDFADVLLSFLTLPLGTVVRLLIKYYGDNAPFIGSLNSLYGANTMTRTDLEMEAQSEDESVFTQKTSSFLLLDNLQILTNTLASLFHILKSNGIKDTNELEERTLIVGLKEIMELLKGSLVSKTPLTDMVQRNSSATATSNDRREFSSYNLPKSKRRKHNSSDAKRITVKVLVQKSTNRFLLVQARKDFIDFLFSLLTIPLGRVQSLLGYNNYLGSINNLFWSMHDLQIIAHFKRFYSLTKPKIPPHYLCLHPVFSLDKQSPPMIYKQQDSNRVKSFGSASPGSGYTQMKMIDPKGEDFC
ncbi:uncharacterized protein [Henckelia pumila]|uniref:uncharacterized protein n=1 Tax=Henckelia pumila TaxID=405737 RepID=UPI003C6E7CCE